MALFEAFPLRLDCRCPWCRSVPALRVSREERDVKLADNPERPVLSYECRCGERYSITVKAFQGAA